MRADTRLASQGSGTAIGEGTRSPAHATHEASARKTARVLHEALTLERHASLQGPGSMEQQDTDASDVTHTGHNKGDIQADPGAARGCSLVQGLDGLEVVVESLLQVRVRAAARCGAVKGCG